MQYFRAMVLPKIKMVFWNIRGFNNTIKRKHVSLNVAKMDADIVLLQEIHMRLVDPPAFKNCTFPNTIFGNLSLLKLEGLRF